MSEIRGRIALTQEDENVLRKNGLAVLANAKSINAAWAYAEMYTADLPIFVTMESLFWAVAVGHEAMLRSVEQRRLMPEMRAILATMHAAPGVDRDADLYLTIARSLLEEQAVEPRFADNIMSAEAWLAQLMEAGGMALVEIFGRQRNIDFSLFLPRGPYAEDVEMARWFRAAMWLTRFELNVVSRDCRSSHPGLMPDVSETPREAALAVTLAQLAESTRVAGRIEALSQTLDVMLAPRADVSSAQLADWQPAGFDHAKLIAGIGRRFVRVTPTHPMPPVSDQPVVWTMLGLRPTESTDTFAAMLTPNVDGRQALNGSDVAVALGHERARSHLRSELKQFPRLAEALAKAATMFADLRSPNTLRDAWLEAITGLAEVPQGAVPSFVGGAAYADFRMNTALGAYARLRRNHVAYEAATFQWSGCDVPDGYVEPAPAALAGLVAYAKLGQARARQLDPSGAIGVAKYYRRLERTFSALQQIVARELVGAPLSRAELDFIHQIAEVHEPTYDASLQFDGWYMGLFFEHRDYNPAPVRREGEPIGMRAVGFEDPNVPDAMAVPDIAVDIATALTGGHGVVSHLGTSPTHWAVFVVDVGGAPRALVGPVSLAYSAARVHPERLTDRAARGLSVHDRRAPWTKTFAPWYTRTKGRWPTAMIDIECVHDEGDDCRDVAMRFASEELVGRLDVALYGRDGERIARRISYVRAGRHEVTFGLPRGRGPLDERIGHISIRRGDDEQIVDTYDEVFGTANYPLEVALGELAHEGKDWDDEGDDDTNEGDDGGALDTDASIVKGSGK